jgi:hypothetical protein
LESRDGKDQIHFDINFRTIWVAIENSVLLVVPEMLTFVHEKDFQDYKSLNYNQNYTLGGRERSFFFEIKFAFHFL